MPLEGRDRGPSQCTTTSLRDASCWRAATPVDDTRKNGMLPAQPSPHRLAFVSTHPATTRTEVGTQLSEADAEAQALVFVRTHATELGALSEVSVHTLAPIYCYMVGDEDFMGVVTITWPRERREIEGVSLWLDWAGKPQRVYTW